MCRSSVITSLVQSGGYLPVDVCLRRIHEFQSPPVIESQHSLKLVPQIRVLLITTAPSVCSSKQCAQHTHVCATPANTGQSSLTPLSRQKRLLSRKCGPSRWQWTRLSSLYHQQPIIPQYTDCCPVRDTAIFGAIQKAKPQKTFDPHVSRAQTPAITELPVGSEWMDPISTAQLDNHGSSKTIRH